MLKYEEEYSEITRVSSFPIQNGIFWWKI